MLHRATSRDIDTQSRLIGQYPLMPQRIDGIEYYSMAEVILATGICRQTLWRWRKASRIPQGHLLRDRQVIYTESEFRAIQEFASRVQPIGAEARDQLRLFGQTGQ